MRNLNPNFKNFREFNSKLLPNELYNKNKLESLSDIEFNNIMLKLDKKLNDEKVKINPRFYDCFILILKEFNIKIEQSEIKFRSDLICEYQIVFDRVFKWFKNYYGNKINSTYFTEYKKTMIMILNDIYFVNLFKSMNDNIKNLDFLSLVEDLTEMKINTLSKNNIIELEKEILKHIEYYRSFCFIELNTEYKSIFTDFNKIIKMVSLDSNNDNIKWELHFIIEKVLKAYINCKAKNEEVDFKTHELKKLYIIAKKYDIDKIKEIYLQKVSCHTDNKYNEIVGKPSIITSSNIIEVYNITLKICKIISDSLGEKLNYKIERYNELQILRTSKNNLKHNKLDTYIINSDNYHNLNIIKDLIKKNYIQVIIDSFTRCETFDVWSKITDEGLIYLKDKYNE